MTKEEIDELITILEENSEEKLIMFYNKIGINCTAISLETNQQLVEKIEENKELLNYLKTQHKEWIEGLLYLFTQENNLEEILENADYYELSTDNIKKLIKRVNNEETLENVISNAKKYGLQKEDIVNIIIEGKNSVLAKNVIENQEKYGLESEDIINIVLELDNKELKNLIISNYENYGLNKEQLIKTLMLFDDKELSETVLSNYEKYNLTKDDIRNYRINSMSFDFIKNNLKSLLKIENATEKEEIILNLCKNNEEILKIESFDILDTRFLDILGKDKINLISCYPDVVNAIIKLNDRQLKVLKKSIDAYMNETKTDEWTYLASRILNNIDSYQELIDEIAEDNDIDMKKINSIIIHPNKFEIKTKDDAVNYEQIRLKKCEKQIKSDSIEDKRDAVFQKIFGIGIEEAIRETQQFGEDIESIQDKELKAYIKSLKEIINLADPDLLEEIFIKVNCVETVNPLLIERKLKNEYCKMYNNGLFKIENATPIDGQSLIKVNSAETVHPLLRKRNKMYNNGLVKIENAIPIDVQSNMYDAGTEFNMIITSVGAFIDHEIENYYEDWNRRSISTQHMCTSYIRNDMMGHADIPHVCYGFSEMAEDSLLLAGSGDITSSMTEFTSTSIGQYEQYYSPDDQINKTTHYNELDFKRIQNGKRKQPDYIVVFKRHGKIENLEESQKASKDFGGLPIVVIDVDKCLEAEKQKAFELEKKYRETRNPEILKKLEQKIRNNNITYYDYDPEYSFCEEIDVEQLYEETQLQEKVPKEDLETIYSEIDAVDRRDETKKLYHIYIEIKDILRTDVEH